MKVLIDEFYKSDDLQRCYIFKNQDAFTRFQQSASDPDPSFRVIEVEILDIGQIKTLQATNEKLRECVEKYADKSMYNGYVFVIPVQVSDDEFDFQPDEGVLARETLKEIDESEGKG